MTLQRGDIVPQFEVRTASGELFSYTSNWQRKNLVLVSLSPAAAGDDDYVGELTGHDAEFSAHDCVCVVTRDAVSGVPAPGALVADKWGEIIHVIASTSLADLPTPSELLEWIDYVASRCPECEGEAK